jgi:hypothetical protein
LPKKPKLTNQPIKQSLPCVISGARRAILKGNQTMHTNCIAFLIPQTRLVSVEYWARGTRYVATIPNPRNNNTLELVMRAKGVLMRQIDRVYPVKELARA